MSYSIPVLTYHSVAEGESIDPKRFERHLEVLAGSGLPSLAPAELGTADRGYLLTLDDGFADVWTQVLPLLEAFRVHAAVFVIPGRTGDGPPRGVSPIAEGATSQDAHRETARGCDRHPGFLRWSELEALEQSGRVTVMSHSHTHRMGWVDDRLVGFNLGRHGGRYWYLAEASGGDERLGIPVYPRGSALAHRLFRDDLGLRQVLADWMVERGGEAYLDRAGPKVVTGELQRLVESHLAAWGRLGSWESDAERERRTLAEIVTAREELEARLGGCRDELCLPWGEYDAVTLGCARRAGVQRVYTLDRGPNPAGSMGYLVNRFEPRSRGAWWLRSRLWIYGSTWRARAYARWSRRGGSGRRSGKDVPPVRGASPEGGLSS